MGDNPIAGDPYAGTLFAPPPAQIHRETSIEAADSVLGSVDGWRRAVYEAIRAAGDSGATDEELQDRLALKQQTQAPRRIELWRAGLVRPSGETRPTRAGRQAIVWVVGEDPDAGRTAAQRRRERVTRLCSVVRRAGDWLEVARADAHAGRPVDLEGLAFILSAAMSAMVGEALAAPVGGWSRGGGK